MNKKLPEQSYLNSILEYNNGILYWKSARPKINIGDIAGSLNKNGYIKIKIDGKIYQIHRIIWKMLIGNDPENDIDHINHIKTDNRIENLRDTNENNKNQSIRKDNTSGYPNILFRKNNKIKYQVRILNNNKHYTKSFSTIEEAVKHRDEKLIEFGYHKNHNIQTQR